MCFQSQNINAEYVSRGISEYKVLIVKVKHFIFVWAKDSNWNVCQQNVLSSVLVQTNSISTAELTLIKAEVQIRKRFSIWLCAIYYFMTFQPCQLFISLGIVWKKLLRIAIIFKNIFFNQEQNEIKQNRKKAANK